MTVKLVGSPALVSSASVGGSNPSRATIFGGVMRHLKSLWVEDTDLVVLFVLLVVPTVLLLYHVL